MDNEVTPNLLNGMGGRIEGEALLELITKTLDSLEKEYSELKSLLDAEAWNEAGEKAHQLKGSAYLFGCDGILFFLERVVEKNIALIGTSVFKDSFWQRSKECLEQLQQSRESLQNSEVLMGDR